MYAVCAGAGHNLGGKVSSNEMQTTGGAITADGLIDEDFEEHFGSPSQVRKIATHRGDTKHMKSVCSVLLCTVHV